MRAIVIPKNGPPDVFEERELPERRLTPKDVRIRVEAAGVNFADLMGRIGLYPDAPKMPYAPGYEVAGVVEEAGAQVDASLAPGTRVMATTRFWGYADSVRAPQHWCVPLPDDVDTLTAAAVPVNYLTAYLALLHVGGAQAGDRVLVHGGAGGVGLATLDLARGRDLQMYATAGSDEKCRRLEALGVVKAFNYRTEDWAEASRAALRGGGYQLILDPLGPASFQKGIGMLEPLGRIVCYGFSQLVEGPKRKLWKAATKFLTAAKINPITMMNENKGFHGLNLAQLFTQKALHGRAMGELGRMLAEGAIQPTIDTTFPLSAEGAAAAHTYLHERRNFGKVVLVAG